MKGIDDKFENLDQGIPSQQKLIKRFIDKHRHKAPFEGVTALLIQHQFGNHYLQAKAMIELGMSPENIFWVDIPYTANEVVRKALVELNIPEENFCRHNHKLLDYYAHKQREKLSGVVDSIIRNPPERLLVLDDGAYFIESLMCFEHNIYDRLCVVEQTTRGLIKLNDSAAMRHEVSRIPLINVASSIPKKVLEPPFIGKSVCRSLKRKIGKNFDSNHNKRCLILGYGDIGRRVSKYVWEDLNFKQDNVFVHDPSETQLKSSPFPVWNRENLNDRFDLVIGCSGRTSFDVDDHVFLNDGAILASASSGTVELSRRKYIELSELEHGHIKIERNGLDENNLHSDIQVRFPGKTVTVLNGSFPVNFLGEVNNIPAKYIQPTVVMMLYAAMVAVSTNEKGIIPLDNDFCMQLDKDFRKLLGPEAVILD